MSYKRKRITVKIGSNVLARPSLLRAIQGTQYSLRTSAHDQRKFFDPATVPHTKTMYGGYA